METLQQKIALSLIPGIGPRLVRRLVAYTGGVEAIFDGKKPVLEKIPGIGSGKAAGFNTSKLLKDAEKEIDIISKKGIKALFYLDKEYPARLRECEDAPTILYVDGEVDFNVAKTISIVGTRKATDYGKERTEEIVNYLAGQHPDILVISGLAYGIDIAAHKAALQANLKTVAALGHGLQLVYPSVHRKYAARIREQGALISEFPYNQAPDPGNFVSRNRIIAGLADAVVVTESGERGGALITADLAMSYNRDVFAIPGKSSDTYSKGCNKLIKFNKAALAESGADIDFAMGWKLETKNNSSVQKALFVELTPEEEQIMQLFSESDELAIDEISVSLSRPVARISATMLNLEFNGLVRSLPGKYFKKL